MLPSHSRTQQLVSDSSTHDYNSAPQSTTLADDAMSEQYDSRADGMDTEEAACPRKHDGLSGLDARRHKRFTLTLPIQTNFNSLQSPAIGCAVPSGASSTSGSEEAVRPPTPSDTSFLTAIAAQERRVLELKEELVKAEQSLYKLKKEWAIHEVHKKRQDIKRMRSTRISAHPATIGSQKGSTTIDESSNTAAQEAEKRRAMHHNSRLSNRTIFTGSRHARTLSLLSPEPTTGSFPSPQPLPAGDVPKLSHKRVVSGEMARTKIDEIATDSDLPREVILRAGRQMATDFKDGLWTFLEDLRQVTVGDETTTIPRARQPRVESYMSAKPVKDRRSKAAADSPSRMHKSKQTANRQQLRPTHATATDFDTGGTSPKDSAIGFEDGMQPTEGEVQDREQDPPMSQKTPRRGSMSKTSRIDKRDDFDAWDTWESPKAPTPARNQTDIENIDPDSVRRKPNFRDLLDNAYAEDAKDPIPWPTLVKLTPSTLRRTANHLMNEWEKSISPSNETRVGRLIEDHLDSTGTMPITPKID